MSNIVGRLATLLCAFYTVVSLGDSPCNVVRINAKNSDVFGQGIVFDAANPQPNAESETERYILTPAHVWATQSNPLIRCGEHTSQVELIGISPSADLAVLKILDREFKKLLKPAFDLNQSELMLARHKAAYMTGDIRTKSDIESGAYTTGMEKGRLTFYVPHAGISRVTALTYFFRESYFWPYNYWAHFSNGVLDGVSGALLEVSHSREVWEPVGMILRYNNQNSRSAAFLFAEMIPYIKSLLRGKDSFQDSYPRLNFNSVEWINGRKVLMRNWILGPEPEQHLKETCGYLDQYPSSYAVISGGSDWGDGGGHASMYTLEDWTEFLSTANKKLYFRDPMMGDTIELPKLFLAPYKKACRKVNLRDGTGKILNKFTKKHSSVTRPTDALYKYLAGRISQEALMSGLSDAPLNRRDSLGSICKSNLPQKLMLIGENLMSPVARIYEAVRKERVWGRKITLTCDSIKAKLTINIELFDEEIQYDLSLEETSWHQNDTSGVYLILTEFLPDESDGLRLSLEDLTNDKESTMIRIPRRVFR